MADELGNEKELSIRLGNDLSSLGEDYGSRLESVLLRMSGGKELLRLKEVSEILNLDYKVVYLDVSKGAIPACRFGSIWFLTIHDIAEYMANGTGQASKRSVIENIVKILNPSDIEDYIFRQELDSYICDRVKEISLKLREPYATAYVVAEVSSLLYPEKQNEHHEPPDRSMHRKPRQEKV